MSSVDQENFGILSLPMDSVQATEVENMQNTKYVPETQSGNVSKQGSADNACMWIFGYGSLIWKVDFPIESRIVGYIKGYHRRFWQLSEDHRGVPGAPGRVVTLVAAENPEEKLYGVAYKIAEQDVENVTSHLDYREKGGYSRVATTFYPTSTDIIPFSIFLYIGLRENTMFSETVEVEQIAIQIHRAVGPSGPNTEYLLNLADALRTIHPVGEQHTLDEHVFALEKFVRRMQNDAGVVKPVESLKFTEHVVHLDAVKPERKSA